ncbi:hypothetical protein ACWFMI_24610 [Nocardiopsis terrae]|uniref:hypothetical protein n=1 Tax=Streptomyces sp. NPDC057554 TaxID=3350538 RepID=UPI00369B0910
MRLPPWLLHYSSRGGLALLCTGSLLLGVHLRTAAVVMLLGLALLALGARHHLGRLCELCFAAMPLDMSAAATQRRWMLRLVHLTFGHRPWKVLAGGVALIVLGLLAAAHISVLALVGVNVGAAVLWVAVETHMRYQPWCPWCGHGRGGGGKDDAPAPAPPTGPEAELPVAAR